MTDDEINAALFPFDRDSSFDDIARAIIAAHTAKLLADVEMPEAAHYWEPDGTLEWLGKDGSGFSTNTGPAHGWKVSNYFTIDQLQQYAAAAAAQAREKALDDAKGVCLNWSERHAIHDGCTYEDCDFVAAAVDCAAAIDKLKETP